MKTMAGPALKRMLIHSCAYDTVWTSLHLTWMLKSFQEKDSTITTLLFISSLIVFLAISQTRDYLLENLENITRGTDNTHRIEFIKIQQKTGDEEQKID